MPLRSLACDPDAAFMLIPLRWRLRGALRDMGINLLALIPPPGSNLIRSIRLTIVNMVRCMCVLGTISMRFLRITPDAVLVDHDRSCEGH